MNAILKPHSVASATIHSMWVAAFAAFTFLAHAQTNVTPAISSGYNSATSTPAALTVKASPSLFFVYQPISQGAVAGETVTLRAIPNGEPRPPLQWLFNGQPISGATSPVLTLTHITTNQAGSYAAVVSNETGACTSQVARVAVSLPGPLDRWTWRHPLPQGNDLMSVACGKDNMGWSGWEKSSNLTTYDTDN
jgi:hypothetical protein